MRINIKTNGKRITDVDIRCLFLLAYALDKSSPRMVEANLRFVADKFGYKLVKKDKETQNG